MSEYHEPVLREQSIDYLVTNPDGVYVDLNFGGGGHTRELLKRLNKSAKVIAFDFDVNAGSNIWEDDRLFFNHADFRFLKRFLRMHGYEKVDGILGDLGISTHQLENPSYGLSYRREGPLDMRLDNRQSLTAADILNNYSREKIASILYANGEVRYSRKLAEAIVDYRRDRPFRTTADLLAVAEPFAQGKRRNTELAKISQALRLEISGELEALKMMLEQSIDVLKPGGRLVVISYHSLEDRLVKNIMRSGSFDDKDDKRDLFGNRKVPFKRIVTKAIKPSDEEIKRNPRSRSARMRIAERTEEEF